MKYPKTDEMTRLLKDNLATPYIKSRDNHILHFEIGYCCVDDKDTVVEKRIVDISYNRFVISSSNIYMSVTYDGSIRFWQINPKKYLQWELDDINKVIKLKMLHK